MENKEQKNSKLPKLKKNIKEFLNSEEGKISKKSVMKAGVTLALLGAMLDPYAASAAHSSIHSNASKCGWKYQSPPLS